MIRFIIVLQLVSSIYGQKIMENFEKDRNNRYIHEETYRFNDVPDDGSYTLSLESVEGDIQISGHAGSGVEIEISRKVKATSDERAKRIIQQSKIDVFHISDENLIRIKTNYKPKIRRGISTVYDLKIPTNIQLNIKTAGGDIEVSHIRGESNIQTSGGDIEITKLSGKLDIATAGGDIECTSIEGLARIHTAGGDIVIKHSDGQFNTSTSGGDMDFHSITGNIEAHTSGGSITLENIEGNEIEAKTSGGDIQADNIKASINGATSGGSIELNDIIGTVDIVTSGGDIELFELKGNLKCHTSGGDIDGGNIVGGIDASTTAGDIDLTIIYDSDYKDYLISAETHSGDIDIHIPLGLPVTIDAVIFGTGSPEDLNSDIPLSISKKDNRIFGEGKHNSGTVPVRLRASFGSISIEQE